MDIKDIAEQVARNHGTGGWQTLEDMVRYGEALVAEIQRRGGPVGYFAADQGGIHFALEPDEYHNWLQVFTFPPSTEALEDKVAEACAELASRWGESHGCGVTVNASNASRKMADAIRSGKWKKFRKGE